MVDLFSEIVQKTHRVPIDTTASGNGAAIARKLDVVLMKSGFKLHGDLLIKLSTLHPTWVETMAANLFRSLDHLIGNHRIHNVYFKKFPDEIPDTVEFWNECIADALFDPRSAEAVSLQLASRIVNLLDLPKYGKYLHSYDEMLAAHEQFMPHIKDRVTVLRLGGKLADESRLLYFQLAESTIPVSESDRVLLENLAEILCDAKQPANILVREHRAIINAVRMSLNKPLLVNAPTDILRLAAHLSSGDVTLETLTKFKSFKRSDRRKLLRALSEIVKTDSDKLQDIKQYSEQWKRLGERLHPGEFPKAWNANNVFAIARGDIKAASFNSQIESAFSDSWRDAVAKLREKPGVLFRTIDRVLRSAPKNGFKAIERAVQDCAEHTSGRVLLSVREHLQNRAARLPSRVFVNRSAKAWVCPDTRDSLDSKAIESICSVIDAEIRRRVKTDTRIIVDPTVLAVALPLSEKTKPRGFGVLPRGSTTPVASEIIRFFAYWKQEHDRTDYDLSTFFLGADFTYAGQISWTNLRNSGDGTMVHSGDITEAANGASEFINVKLSGVNATYIIPQLNVYSGESFDEVREVFVGYMGIEQEQRGKPFEPRTVRMKSGLSGSAKVALPFVFMRQGKGWQVKWMHLYLKGTPNCNRVEANRLNVSILIRSIVQRRYLTVDYLVNLMVKGSVEQYSEAKKYPKSALFIGPEAPANAPSKIYTPLNLKDLIPE